jgi:hypothetical protein
MRSFFPAPVTQSTIQKLLRTAATASSYCQNCRIYVSDIAYCQGNIPLRRAIIGCRVPLNLGLLPFNGYFARAPSDLGFKRQTLAR